MTRKSSILTIAAPASSRSSTAGTAIASASGAAASSRGRASDATEQDGSASRESAREKRKQATDLEWVPVTDGVSVPCPDLPDFLGRYFTRHAPGRGYRTAGAIDRAAAQGCFSTDYECAYKHCPARLRVVKDTSKRYACVSRASADGYKHNDHLQDINDPGLPGYVRAVVGKTELLMKPLALRKWLRDEHPELIIYSQLKKKLVWAHQEEMKRKEKELLKDSSGRGKFGGVYTALLSMQRAHLIAKGNYDEDTCYVVGTPQLDSTLNLITFVVSTDNMLLNAYRQALFGLPTYVAVDTTHRLVVEKHCLMPITTTSMTQHTHIIAYGVCTKEDVAAHEYVLRCVKEGVEHIVQERAESGERV
jgi:hypothetical protein